MRNRLLALLVLLMLSACIMPLPLGSTSASGYIRGFWRFDEGAGTITFDSSGFDNDGTVCGGALWTDGKVGKALDFDGVNDYVEVPDSDSLDITGRLTLEAWIYPYSMTHMQVIVAKYNHSAPYNGAYYMGIGGYGYLNKILFGLSYDGLHFYYMLSNTNITANTWTHVAATSNGTHMILYIDGNEDNVRVYAPGVIYASTAPLRIGCYLPELGYPRFFNGTIDEVKVSATPILTVDDDRVQCPTADFTNIQSAIDAALSGDTIKVYEGTYTEQLVINKSLTLLGDPGPIIVAPDTRNTYTIAESTATWDPIIFAYGGTESGGAVSGSGTISVTIDGFEIDGGNKATTARFVGILYRNVNPGVVSNNKIHDMYDADGEGDGPETFGIMVYGDSDVTIEFNEIRDFSRGGIGVQGDDGVLPDPTATVKLNTVFGNGLETGSGWWAENGIQIGRGAGGSIIGNNVSDCQVNNPNWVATGIMAYDAIDGTDILDNTVADCDTGIAVISPSYDLIDGNIVTGCTWDGIRLGWPVNNCTVSNNVISGSWAGIGVWDASDNTIQNNIIEDNEYGIYMDGDSNNNTILGNDILTNLVDGIHIEPYGGFDPSGTQIHCNKIVGNGVSGVNKTGTEIVDATWNWWGSNTGPYHPTTNPSGTGDGVSDYVDYEPWKTKATLKVEPTTYQAKHINETFSINVTINDLSEDWKMVSVQFRLSYNSTLLEVLDVTEGPFMNQAGFTLFLYLIEDDGIYGPHVLVGILLLPQWTTFPYGSGTLATITFNATYCQREDPVFLASCDLTLVDTILVNSDIEDVLHDVENGHYEIECHICDLNMDGRVDMRDIAYSARAFGAYPGHPRWDPVIDINGDGIINMRDIAYVARNFGWDC